MREKSLNRLSRVSAVLVQLQSRRFVAAAQIAERFGVSLRTVYRDIRTLEAAGVPVGSEPGRGYFLAEGYRLPPVMFTYEEAGALITAGKFIERHADASLRSQFESALSKVLAVMGRGERDLADGLRDRVGVFAAGAGREPRFLSEIQRALCANRAITIEYRDAGEQASRRTVEPLGLFLYGGRWYLHAYCRLRNAYRSFRADRLGALALTDETFEMRRHAGAVRTVMELMEGISRPPDGAPGT